MKQSIGIDLRLKIYKLLQQLYRYPIDREALLAVQAISFEEPAPLSRAWLDLQESIPLVIDENWEEQMKIEMTRLMEGPGRTPAPPYASYYLDGNRLIGFPAKRAQQTYLEMGVMPQNPSIPADHLVTELGFLAYLAERATTSQDHQSSLQVSLKFLQEQVQPWVNSFCHSIEKASRKTFFINLSRFTSEWLNYDAAWLQAVLANTMLNAN